MFHRVILSSRLINSSLSSNLGVPPLLSEAHLDTIRTMGSHISIPNGLAAQVEIQRQVARYISALDISHDPHTRISLTRLHDRELENLRSTFREAWSADIEFNLLGSKLYLYGLCFATPSMCHESSPVTGSADQHSIDLGLSPQVILYRGLGATIRLTETFSISRELLHKRRRQCEESSVDGQHISDDHMFYPKYYFQTLFFAGCFLLFYLSAGARATPNDEEIARNHIRVIYDIFSEFSTEEHKDAARHLEKIMKVVNQNGRQLGITVETRLGANIWFSALRIAKTAKLHASHHNQEEGQHTVGSSDGRLDISLGNDHSSNSALPAMASPLPMWEFPWAMEDNPLLDGDLDLDALLA